MLLSTICSIIVLFWSHLQVYKNFMKDIYILLLSFTEVWKKNYFGFFLDLFLDGSISSCYLLPVSVNEYV